MGAIELGLRNLTVPRPTTFRFVAELLGAAGAQVEEVRIESLKDGVLYAVAKVRRGKTVREIDARPSDALALAVRTGSPIRVPKELLGQAVRDAPTGITPPAEGKELPILGVLPVLPPRDATYFPHAIFSIFIGRDKSVCALDGALNQDRYALLLAQKQARVDRRRLYQLTSRLNLLPGEMAGGHWKIAWPRVRRHRSSRPEAETDISA